MYSTSCWKINVIYQEGIKGVGAEICIDDKSQEIHWKYFLHVRKKHSSQEQRKEQVKIHEKHSFHGKQQVINVSRNWLLMGKLEF